MSKATDIGITDIAPQDRIPYYGVPVEQLVTLTAGTVTQILMGDPYRVYIGFAFNTSSANLPVVSTLRSLTSGIAINTGGILDLFVDRHGPLVTLPWFGYAQSVGTAMLTVITLQLYNWPNSPPDTVIDQVDNGTFVDPATRAAAATTLRKLPPRPLTDDELMQLIRSCSSGYPKSPNGGGYVPPPQWGIPPE